MHNILVTKYPNLIVYHKGSYIQNVLLKPMKYKYKFSQRLHDQLSENFTPKSDLDFGVYYRNKVEKRQCHEFAKEAM